MEVGRAVEGGVGRHALHEALELGATLLEPLGAHRAGDAHRLGLRDLLVGSGGTIAPGNFCASCEASQSKSRKRRITLNWPNLNCGSVVRVVTSYV